LCSYTSSFPSAPFRIKWLVFLCLCYFVTHQPGSCGVVNAFTKGKKWAKAKHWRLSKLDDREAPSDSISVDEGHHWGA